MSSTRPRNSYEECLARTKLLLYSNSYDIVFGKTYLKDIEEETKHKGSIEIIEKIDDAYTIKLVKHKENKTIRHKIRG